MKNEKNETEKDSVVQGEEDDIRCYVCGGSCNVSIPMQRNICDLCIEAFDGYLFEERYLKHPSRLREEEDADNFHLCDACLKPRREVWNDFICKDCWGLLRTYRYSYGLCQECKGCPNLDVFE